MYDELIEALRLCVKYDKAEDALENAEQAADVIEGLSHAVDQMTEWRKNPWIPVTERTPKKEETYWCCTNQGVMCECRWTNDRYGLGVSDMWGWNIMDVPQYQKITHWMPLPKPPKEEA